ncbi:MAG: hypothetical protein Q4A71_06535 [Actinomycetaceae bacterium]|nr:hypothetical protein [Actinomycetaceae bacterium]
MARFFYDEDADATILHGQVVVVLGYDKSARAAALNLRDGGVQVLIGSEDPAEISAAAEQGLKVQALPQAVAAADIVLVTENTPARVFNATVSAHLSQNQTVVFMDPQPVRYETAELPENVDICLLMPLADGTKMRKQFEIGRGIPAVLAVEQDLGGGAKDKLLALASALGCLRAGGIFTTFEEAGETAYVSAALAKEFASHIAASFAALTAVGYGTEISFIQLGKALQSAQEQLQEGALGNFEDAHAARAHALVCSAQEAEMEPGQELASSAEPDRGDEKLSQSAAAVGALFQWKDYD